MNSISVVTATFNCEKDIRGLVESLISQTDSNFEWIVADGGSSDRTLEVVDVCKGEISLKVINGPDFGIYDGLNKAIESASGEFYIVVGADDVLDKNAILNFKESIDGLHSIITSSNERQRLMRRTLNRFDALAPMRKYVYGHSVYSCFRRSLHDKYGLYSRRFPIAADLLFIRKCVKNGEKIKVCDFSSGRFSSEGVSSKDQLGVLSETMRVQVETGVNEYLALLVFLVRFLWSKVRQCVRLSRARMEL